MGVLDKFRMKIRNEIVEPTCHVITPPAGFEVPLSVEYHKLDRLAYSNFGLLLGTSMTP